MERYQMTEEQLRTDFVSGLRQLATVYEQNADLPLPDWTQTITIYPNKDKAKACAKRMIEILGGTKKEYDSDYFRMFWKFGQFLELKFLTSRETVCEPVIVGKKVIPAMPERILPATEEREEDIIEWQCSSILGE